MSSLPQRFASLLLFICISPLLAILYILVKLDSPGPFIFRQKRVGKNKELFTIYKIRTMVTDAEVIKNKYKKLNQGVGPIFKIYNDPRHTRIGRFINHMFLDELPQLINIAKGEMAFVGPRPLLISDVKNTPRRYDLRFSVLPGLTSPWNIQGRYKLSFDEWMRLDVEYVNEKSFWIDFKTLTLTGLFLLRMGVLEFKDKNLLSNFIHPMA